jgi:hypothetical protein
LNVFYQPLSFIIFWFVLLQNQTEPLTWRNVKQNLLEDITPNIHQWKWILFICWICKYVYFY